MYYDKIYNYYSKLLNKELNEVSRDVLHWLYTGIVEGSAKELAESNKLSMLGNLSRGNIYRSFDLLETISRATDLEEGESEEDKAKFRNEIKNGDIAKLIARELKDKEDNDKLLYGLAPGLTDHLQDIDSDEMKRRANLHKLMNVSYVKKIMRLFGALYEHVNDMKKKKRLPDPTSFSNVITGNNMQDLLLSEFLKLADEDMESMFNMQFIQSQLLQYERTSRKDVGRGDVDIYLDCSGSMCDLYMELNLDNKLQQFSFWEVGLALSLTLVRLAFDDRRKPKCYTFNTSVYELDVSSMSNAIESLLGVYKGGGTLIEAVLNKIDSNSSKDRDSFIITDAFDNVRSTSITKTKSIMVKNNSRLFCGYLSCGYPTPLWMNDFDKVVTLSSGKDNVLNFLEGMV